MSTDQDNNKKNPFRVPDGYFEELPDRIMSKVKNEGLPRPKTFDIIKPYIYMAAAFVLLVVLIKGGLSLFVDKNDLNPVKPIETKQTAFSYSEDELISDESLFIEAISEAPIQNGISELSTETLEEYLMNYDLTDEFNE